MSLALEKPSVSTDSAPKINAAAACNYQIEPIVSVIIPAYNAAAFIAQTLESVLTQTYQNLEVLVIDDGSQDETPRIVQRYMQQDHRVRLLRQSNSGVAAARNLGIKSARGQFIAPIDADDIWYPEALSKLVFEFEAANYNTGVVYAWSVDIDEQGRPTGGFHAAMVSGDVHKTLICHNFLGNASSTLIRKSYLEQVAGYSTFLQAQNAQGCEDWDLYLRLAEVCEFRAVPEFLVGYRKLKSSMSGNLSRMAQSHQIMVDQAKLRCPHVPEFLYRLSSSSFYLYLAQQSHCSGQSKETLWWLMRAIKVDPVTPFIRASLYILAIKNLAKPGIRRLLASRFTPMGMDYVQYVIKRFTHSQQAQHSSASLKNTPSDIDASLAIDKRVVRLKVFVSSMLHYIVKFGTYDFSNSRVSEKPSFSRL